MKKMMRKCLNWGLAVAVLFPMAGQMDTAAAPVKDGKIYGIGSISKMFGTVAVMKLVDRGQVALDAPVTDYLPDFKMADERYRQITVRMLLNHSSGIMGSSFHNAFLLGEGDTSYHDDFLENLGKQGLKADPGQYSVYCNDGFTLAEILVERVSGKSFSQFIEKELTQPLGMRNSFMPADLVDVQGIAPVYFQNRQLPYENLQCLAAGGIYSTPEDLCLFSQIFMENGNGLLSKESISAMANPEYKGDEICVQEGDSVFGYGLGWDSVDAYPYEKYGITALTKGGDTGNYHAGLTVLPKQNLSVSVTASGGSSSQCQIMAQQIALEVLKENQLLPGGEAAPAEPEKGDSAKIPEEQKVYGGIYASSQIWKAEFTQQNTLRLTCLENEEYRVQEYRYTAEGNYVSTRGNYISEMGTLASAEDGISGWTSFRFSKEANGKTYMLGTTYAKSAGMGQAAMTMAFAEKIEENIISDSVRNLWEKRNGQKYYMVEERSNSSAYITQPILKLELMEDFSGYTGAISNVKNCRITDAFHAVNELDLPVVLGRDLKDYYFYEEKGTEMLQVGDYRFMPETALLPSGELKGSIPGDGRGIWYAVEEKEAGVEISIEVPQNGAYYVYDKAGSCVAGSLLKGEKKQVLLPKEGRVLLVAEVGSSFIVGR